MDYLPTTIDKTVILEDKDYLLIKTLQELSDNVQRLTNALRK